MTCKMSVRPLLYNGAYYSQVITLQFLANSLEMDKINVFADGTTGSTKAVYTKK